MFFFFFKENGIKIKIWKKCEGWNFGGTWWNRVLEKRAVWAKVAEDDYLLCSVEPRRAVWLPWCERESGQGTWSQSAPGGAQSWVPYLTICPSALTLLEIYRKISLTSTGTVWPAFCNCLFKHCAVYQNMPFVTQGKVTKVQEDKWPLFPLMSEYYLWIFRYIFLFWIHTEVRKLVWHGREYFKSGKIGCGGIKG